ncbi:acetolactate decarboxylase [Elizabethkingia meningoseptica]|uniref:acetolactate decarboxylase n=1 Tax=Elizabethkingia meningoseptica TaxID=238 RepID=UPI0023AF2DAC|nr:acetolactate decarboxylase [Elizabethkingia meningoseptica]MDE5468388.1 acetolactate decarboxylase [Elizabethkingia meningoseptica]MDE5475559.1 acetolactate decarboxylase [Elizabethkingia meningoseptica]MDE5479435.1 acetolactate decarboxylase [Elizabethkingia meningoseptica]MDE5485588.1 acetolactate decarboxylase [Elizabethkingia meningoseptica]MDE5502837.1 acetolactate decarboxylase [Elizabethkingia meningoseptica]
MNPKIKNRNRRPVQTENILYNYGIIEALVGGLYEGTLSIEKLLLKGNFGIGAPGMLDGELTIMDGIAYQTKSTGETTILSDQQTIAFSSVSFFTPEISFHISDNTEQSVLFETIINRLANNNAMYALKITGKFSYIKTRAFPLIEEPFPVLSSILDRQQLFEYTSVSGALIGYLLPEYLNGINAGGFHFHFLSEDKVQGGHVLDFTARDLTIEIAELKSFELEVSNSRSFKDFQFRKRYDENLHRVERGY